MATKHSQRIVIWVIAIVMAVGTLGAYFLVILDANNSKREQEELFKSLQEQQGQQQAQDIAELQVEDLKVGEGTEVKATDSISVHYLGTLAKDGTKFDSSYDRGEPITFKLEGVIRGWQEGLVGMKEGGKRRLLIPSDKAYGEQGYPPNIPPNADLIFEVELLKVNP